MSKIYNQLKEIQEQKKSEVTSSSTKSAADEILPPFSRSARKPIPQKNKISANMLFFLVVSVSSVTVIGLFLVARTIGAQRNLVYEKTTLSSEIKGIKTVVNENTKGFGLLAGMIKGLNGSIKSMDERLEAANVRFARIERQSALSAAETSTFRKENRALLERIALLEKRLNIKNELSTVTASKKKKLLDL